MNTTNDKFIKLMRTSQDFDYLMSKRPAAFLLLSFIAKRAKRSIDHPDPTLEIGECYIGDYEIYGATEQTYRTDKAFLKSTSQITTRTTNRGTIARIVKTSIFDINAEEPTTESTGEPTGNQRTINGQPTTNKNVKNEKKEERMLFWKGKQLSREELEKTVTTEQLKEIDFSDKLWEAVGA